MESGRGNWKAKAIAIGALIGALTGAATAMFLVRRSETHGETLRVTTGEGLRLGMLVAGLLREVAALPDREKV